MPTLKLGPFYGQAPRTSPALLPANAAELAENCNLLSGEIRPFRSPVKVANLGKRGFIQTLFLFQQTYWFHWTEDVDVVRSPIAQDTHDRHYFTGESFAPQITTKTLATMGEGKSYPLASRDLGVPRPETALVCNTAGSGGTGSARSLAYVVTMVTDLGEEGPPSPAMENPVSARNGELVFLSGFPTGIPDYIESFRIYRANTASSGSTKYQFVREVPASTVKHEDVVLDKDLGEVLPSSTWLPPPAEMKGVVAMPGGFLAGFYGQTIRFSEPWYPHAWPPAYAYTVDYPVVALGVYGSTLCVLTTARPYLANVSHPEVVQLLKHPAMQGCVSKRGTISAENGVIFPTPDGLFLLSDSGSGLLTKSVLTREAWQKFNPQSLTAAVHDGRYYGFYRDGVEVEAFDLCTRQVQTVLGRGFVFDPSESSVGFTELGIIGPPGLNGRQAIQACHVSPETDSLFFVLNDPERQNTGLDENFVYEWNTGAFFYEFAWKSKHFDMSPRNLSSARVEARFGDVPTQAEIDARQAEIDAIVAENQVILDGYIDDDTGWINGVDDGVTGVNGGIGLAPICGTGGNNAPIAGDYLKYVPPMDLGARALTVALFIDDGETAVFTKTVTNQEPFRLPGGRLGRQVRVKVSGNVDMKKVLMATSMAELVE